METHIESIQEKVILDPPGFNTSIMIKIKFHNNGHWRKKFESFDWDLVLVGIMGSARLRLRCIIL